MIPNRTERVRRHYDRSAGSYDRIISWAEKAFFGGGREWVCSRARGEVLEIAAGTGRNLTFYPEDVLRLTGIELSPKMLDIARRRARELGREADLRAGDAQNLPFPEASFHTVVATLALCTIPDDRRAVTEAARVLRPDGRLLLLEHVRSSVLPVRLLQRVLDPLAVLIDHDHLLREPLRHVEEAGLVIKPRTVEVGYRREASSEQARQLGPVRRSAPFSCRITLGHRELPDAC